MKNSLKQIGICIIAILVMIGSWKGMVMINPESTLYWIFFFLAITSSVILIMQAIKFLLFVIDKSPIKTSYNAPNQNQEEGK